MSDLALGVYVHWPYCARICPYCDFNVYKNRAVGEAAWAAAFARDLDRWGEQIDARPLTSLYFGGGTPSLMPPSLAAQIIDLCADRFGFVSGAEITLEANPTDAEASRFSAFRAAGVTRLSLGVQSFDDDQLSFLGRNHSGREARLAVDQALAGFGNVTFDLIYGLPEEAPAGWQARLAEAVATGVPHLSVYQLTIEPGTAFHRAVARGDWTPISDDEEATFYALAGEELGAAGYVAYEISSHAKPGFEARHNKLYWQYQDYIGLGPGAHGRLTTPAGRFATVMAARPTDYLNGMAPLVESLSPHDQLTECLSMGLRLSEGIDRRRLESFAPAALNEEVAQLIAADGLLSITADRVALTERGRPLLNRIVLELLA